MINQEGSRGKLAGWEGLCTERGPSKPPLCSRDAPSPKLWDKEQRSREGRRSLPHQLPQKWQSWQWQLIRRNFKSVIKMPLQFLIPLSMETVVQTEASCVYYEEQAPKQHTQLYMYGKKYPARVQHDLSSTIIAGYLCQVLKLLRGEGRGL